LESNTFSELNQDEDSSQSILLDLIKFE